MNAPLGIRRRDEAVEPVDLSRKARQAISEEAAFRRVGSAGLVSQILEAVAAHDLFAEILNREGGL